MTSRFEPPNSPGLRAEVGVRQAVDREGVIRPIRPAHLFSSIRYAHGTAGVVQGPGRGNTWVYLYSLKRVDRLYKPGNACRLNGLGDPTRIHPTQPCRAALPQASTSTSVVPYGRGLPRPAVPVGPGSGVIPLWAVKWGMAVASRAYMWQRCESERVEAPQFAWEWGLGAWASPENARPCTTVVPARDCKSLNYKAGRPVGPAISQEPSKSVLQEAH
jgi:hypothetical protein